MKIKIRTKLTAILFVFLLVFQFDNQIYANNLSVYDQTTEISGIMLRLRAVL